MIIELIITYREPYPYTEIGRLHKFEKYNSLTELIETTFTDDYVRKRHYELTSCKNHITVLVGELKYRYSCYNEYKQNIRKNVEYLHY